MQQLSVVIPNYNYERFVGDAIDSALSLRWPDVDIVVVDDGSTDGSLDIIRSFGDRIRVLATENASQRVAINRGFALCTGDVVIFLDSDDLLPPDLPERVAAIWAPAVSKAQFQMQRIDADGAALGSPFPTYQPLPDPAEIRRWATLTSAYPSPPGSGNAYARWFLERILPVESAEVGNAADSPLLAAAPFFGDVVSVAGAVVKYRQHDSNDSDLLRDHSRFPREVERARARWNVARSALGDAVVDERPLFRSRELLQLRIASCRMAPGAHPLPGDRRVRMARDLLTSPIQPGPERWVHRIAVVGWCLLTLVAPHRFAHRLIQLRYGRHHKVERSRGD